MFVSKFIVCGDIVNREFGKYNGNVSKDVLINNSNLLEDKGDHKL